MIVHIYDSGSTLHLSKIYIQAGIRCKFIKSSFVRNIALINATAIVVDSLNSLKSLDGLLENTKLYEGGKTTFTKMMGSSIITSVSRTGQPVRLLAGMPPKNLYIRKYQVAYFKILKKITHPHTYVKVSAPNINIIKTDINVLDYAKKRALKLGSEIAMVALDVETKQEGLITGTDGTVFWVYSMIELFQATFATPLPSGGYDLWTAVIPFKEKHQYDNIKEICGSDYPKTFSNGHYDVEQLMHWRIGVVNWAWDVEYYTRSITPDLIGFYNLGLNSAMWNLDIRTWKDLTNHTTDRNYSQQQAFLLYSGLDTHWTAASSLQQLNSTTKTNINNFILKKEFDGLTSFMNMQLLPVDKEENERLLVEATKQRIKNETLFKNTTGLRPNQNKKVFPLFKTLHFNMRKLGYEEMGNLHSLQEKQMSGLIHSHPIWARAVEIFLDAKHGEKNGATFLQYIKYYTARDLDRKNPYFDYSMSQYTTSTLRYASSSSNAWCGGNVQNISAKFRKQYTIPDGNVGISIDAPQSEARTVGYLAECQTIIKVLEDPDLDYHIFNAANSIFKKPYNDITKLERDLVKAPGFGFFYGQRAMGLMLTLGVKSMRELRIGMKLDPTTPLLVVASIISDGIDSLYFEIRKNYYPKVVEHYRTTSRVSTMTGYKPLLISDINEGSTVRTIVCIDGQHSSAHINMIGGVRMLYNFLYGTTPIQKSMYPYLQLHDEIQAICGDQFTVKEVDDYTELLFSNSYEVNGRTMSIPRGIPVFGKNLLDLKKDEIPRTEEVSNLTLKQTLTYKGKDND